MRFFVRSFSIFIYCLTSSAVVLFAQDVDALTGRLRMSIPIGSLQANDISVPLSIYHHGGSIRVAEGEGSCGVGWNLSAGGGVHRQVRGLPDEINTSYRKGWLSRTGIVPGFTPVGNDDLSTWADEEPDFAALEALHANYTKDTEPDVFSVSAPGLAVQFVLEQSGVPRLLSHVDVSIEFLPSVQAMTTIKIKANNGLVYTFGGGNSASDMILRRGYVGNQNEMNTAAKYIPKEFMLTSVGFCYNWKLTSITSTTTGTTAIFSYKTNTSTLADGASKTHYNLDSSNYVLDLYKFYQLESIKLKSYKAVFSWGSNLLQSVKIADTVSLDDRKVEFKYFTASSNVGTTKIINKKFLSEARVTGTTCQRAEAHQFQYQGVTPNNYNYATISNADWRRNWKQDYFGYFTGSGTNRNKPTLYFAEGQNDGRRLRVHAIDGVSYETISGDSRGVSASADFGALKKVIFPTAGYAAIEYESNSYVDTSVSPAVTYSGPGVRVKKLTLQGGEAAFGKSSTDVSGYRAIEKQYEYVLQDGTTTSGKLTAPVTLGYVTTTGAQRVVDNIGDEPAVLYSRVVERTPSRGYTVQEFNVPGMFPETANGSWNATKSRIARGINVEALYLKNGYYLFPYAPSANFDFRRGQPTRVATYSQSDVLLNEKTISYSQISVNAVTIQGVRFEKLGYLYYYGIYNILTGMADYVSQEVIKQASLEDPTKLHQTTIAYSYNSNKMLSSVTTILPNSTTSVKTIKYAKDFQFSSHPASTDTVAVAIELLKATNRGSAIIEEYTSLTLPGPVTTTSSAQLVLYRDFGNGQVLPYLVKSLLPGATLTPASTSGGSFIWDTNNYRTVKRVFEYEEGKPRTEMDVERNVSSTHYTASNTLPAASFLNTEAQQSIFEGFEGGHSFGLTQSGSGFLSVGGGTGQKAVAFVDNTQFLTSDQSKKIQKNGDKYRVSCWVKAASGSIVTFNAKENSTTDVGQVQLTLVETSDSWKYLEGVLTTTANCPPFYVEVRTNASSQSNVAVDDILVMPINGRFSAQTILPFKGVTSSTDDRGFSTKQTYDHLSRPVSTLDQYGNLIKKNEYSSQIVIAPTPLAYMNVSPAQGLVGEPVTFSPAVDGVTNCDPNLTYTWEVDGVPQTAGSGGVMNYTFQTAGAHSVKFTASSALYGTYSNAEDLCVNFLSTVNVTSTVTNSSGQSATLTVDCNSGVRNINLQLPSVPTGCAFNIVWSKNGVQYGYGSTLTIVPLTLSQGTPNVVEIYVANIALDCSAVKDCNLTIIDAYLGNTSFTVTHVANANCQ